MKNNLLILAFILAATAFFIFISCKEDKEPQQKKTLFEDPTQILGKWYSVHSNIGAWMRVDFKDTWFNFIGYYFLAVEPKGPLDRYSYYRIISDSIIEFRRDFWKDYKYPPYDPSTHDTSNYAIWHARYTYINDTLTIFRLYPPPPGYGTIFQIQNI